MDPPINLDVYGTNSWFKDVNRWTTNTDNLFIVVKACIEITKLIKEELCTNIYIYIYRALVV